MVNQYPFVETINEETAAKIIGVSKITLQRARKRGEISYYRVGARIIYSPDHIKNYLTGVEQGTCAQEAKSS